MNAPLALALLLAQGAEPSMATVTAIQPGGQLHVQDALLADVDRDGRADLVLAMGGEGTRELRVHLRSDGPTPFGNRADLSVPLTGDVVAWAVADVHADPGAEVVLLTAEAAFVWRPRAEEARERFAPLLEAPFLWQLPERDRAFAWQECVVDLDGDGLDDLLLPVPGGWRLALQRRGEDGAARFVTAGEPRAPQEPSSFLTAFSSEGRAGGVQGEATDRELSFSLSVGVDEEGVRPSGPLLSVRESTPAPQLGDWDADGDLDLLAQGTTELWVWTQDAEHRFATEPAVKLALPVVRDRTRLLDVSYSAHTLDLDRDRRADCLIFAGDKRSEDVRTQLLVFTQKAGGAGPPLFGDKGLPAQLLVFAGFAGYPDFRDVDGDGLEDLVVSSLRPDLIDMVRSASSQSLSIEYYVYLNRGGRFSKSPDLIHERTVPIDSSKVDSTFLGDLTGDGLSEVLLRDRHEVLRVLLTRRKGQQLILFERPLWELGIDAKADLRVVRGSGQPGKPGAPRKTGPELLVLEPRQVLHVSFP